MSEMLNKQRRAVTQRLGEAMFDAVGLLVRQYLSGGSEPLAAEEYSAPEGAEVNESFDESRFLELLVPQKNETVRVSNALKPPVQPGGAAIKTDGIAARGGTPHEIVFASGEELRGSSMRVQDISERFERDARRYDAGAMLD